LPDPATDRPGVDRPALREQLDRILSSPLFRNSKRYPNLLRYVVEQTLAGHSGELKERTLGVEVFGRSPDYDTNLDPVVRISAAEIRKRIAQYYHEAGHEEEIRIDIPLGSYVPEFRCAVEKRAAQPANRLEPPTGITPVEVPTALPVAPAPEIAPRRNLPARIALAATAVLLLTIGGFAYFRPWAQPGALDDFWGPVLDRNNRSVLLCIGHLHDPDGKPHGVGLSDATALARLSALMQSRGKTWNVLAEDQATFTDVRQGPVILIGAFNQSWALRLANSMRFTFHHETGLSWIQDQQNPSSRRWGVPDAVPGGAPRVVNEDYALISRVVDPAADRVMVTVGGIMGFGTMAAGEFVTAAKYMEAFAKRAPSDWRKKNLQIVISTDVIRGNSGPPKVVASYFW
jgi:hypothetical protein